MDLIQIGKIVNSHSLKGEVRIISNSDFKDQRFKVGEKLYVLLNDDYLSLKIASYRVHKQYDLIKFVEYNNINDILFLKNKYVYSIKDKVKLNDDECHVNDLINFTVINNETGNKIGTIIEYINNPAHGIFNIKLTNNEIRMVPDVKEFIKVIDLENKVIKIKIIDNLI